MAYEINIGGCALYGITSMEESTVRGVAEHDGVGSGAFAIPQNVKLQHWSMRLELTQQNQGQAGWRAADKVLKELRRQLKRQSSVRLIIISDGQRLSQPVLLLDVKHEMNYQGVYSVTLSLIEYVGPGVKTEEIPSIPRPGTPPQAPDTFKAKDAFDNAQRAQNGAVENPNTGAGTPYTDENGNPINPAGVNGDTLIKTVYGPQHTGNSPGKNVFDTYSLIQALPGEK